MQGTNSAVAMWEVKRLCNCPPNKTSGVLVWIVCVVSELPCPRRFPGSRVMFSGSRKNLSPYLHFTTSFQLRHQFLLLQTYQFEDLYEALSYFEKIYDTAETSPYNKALALALYGKSMLLGIYFDILPATQKHTALKFLNNGAAIFREHELFQDYHSTLLLMAETAQKNPKPKLEEAVKLFQQLLESAERRGRQYFYLSRPEIPCH